MAAAAQSVRKRRLKHAETATGWELSAAEHGDPAAVLCEAVVLVMVGLPARGKSYICNSLLRFLRLQGVRAQIFNAGNLRRETGHAGESADFFSASNEEAKALRETLAMQCTETLLEWVFAAPPGVSSLAVLDATNTTAARRRRVLERCQAAVEQHEGQANLPLLRVIFLESICDDPRMLQANYNLKLLNNDYKGATADEALADFKARVQAYEDQYEPLDDAELEFPGAAGHLALGSIRVINGGTKLQFCQLGHSLTLMMVAGYLQCTHLTQRRIILVQEHAVDAAALERLLLEAEARDEGRPADVLCGASRGAALLARELGTRLAAAASQGGEEGQGPRRAILTLRQLEARLGCKRLSTEEQHARDEEVADESFKDLIARMRSVLYMIERLPRSMVIVCPNGEVERVLLAHFRGCPEGVEPADLPLPEGPVVELRRDHKGYSLHEAPLPAAEPEEAAQPP